MYKLLVSRAKIFLVLIGLILFSSSVLAISCDEESEELKRLGEDEYYNTERPMELSSDEHDILEEFYEFMEGRWTGSYTQKECRGKGAASRGQERIKIKTAKVKSEISLNSDLGVKIKSDGEFSDKVSKLFTRGSLGKDFIYTFEVKNNGMLAMSEKHRRGTGNGGAILAEQVYELSGNKKSIKINVVRYINGYFAEEETWVLKKKR